MGRFGIGQEEWNEGPYILIAPLLSQEKRTPCPNIDKLSFDFEINIIEDQAYAAYSLCHMFI